MANPEYTPKIDPLHDLCPARAALDVIRGRWKPWLLWELQQGTRRYSDLQAAVPGIAPQVLTTQLRQLEADGVVSRRVFPEVPPRVEYSLTSEGRELSAALNELELWGSRLLQRRGIPVPLPLRIS